MIWASRGESASVSSAIWIFALGHEAAPRGQNRSHRRGGVRATPVRADERHQLEAEGQDGSNGADSGDDLFNRHALNLGHIPTSRLPGTALESANSVRRRETRGVALKTGGVRAWRLATPPAARDLATAATQLPGT